MDGVRIANLETRERLNALVIPPAWIDVSCPPLHSRYSLAHHLPVFLGTSSSAARKQEARIEAYRILFKAHMDEEIVGQIRNATNSNCALGSERFQREIERVKCRAKSA